MIQSLSCEHHGTLLPDQAQPELGRHLEACGCLDLGVSGSERAAISVGVATDRCPVSSK